MENFSLTHLSLVNSKKDILLDISLDIHRDIFSAQKERGRRGKTGKMLRNKYFVGKQLMKFKISSVTHVCYMFYNIFQ